MYSAFYTMYIFVSGGCTVKQVILIHFFNHMDRSLKPVKQKEYNAPFSKGQRKTE